MTDCPILGVRTHEVQRLAGPQAERSAGRCSRLGQQPMKFLPKLPANDCLRPWRPNPGRSGGDLLKTEALQDRPAVA